MWVSKIDAVKVTRGREALLRGDIVGAGWSSAMTVGAVVVLRGDDTPRVHRELFRWGAR